MLYKRIVSFINKRITKDAKIMAQSLQSGRFEILTILMNCYILCWCVQLGFEHAKFIELFKSLIDTIHTFDLVIMSFKEIPVTPIVTSCAPLLDNLYLFYHEYHFLMILKSNKDMN